MSKLTFNRAAMSRRSALGLGVSGLAAIALGFPCAAAEDARASEDFTFAAVNDIHYFDEQCGTWLGPVFERINKQNPDFCLIVGDLVEHGAPLQHQKMRDLLKMLKMPVHVVIGNHDYDPNDRRDAFEKLYPSSLNYTFEHKGWQFIGLDTTQGRAASNTDIAKETLDFLSKALTKLDKKRPTVLFTHFPMGLLVPGRPRNANALLNQFDGYNLQAVLNGHFHGQTSRAWGAATVSTNTCCSFRRKNHDFDPRKGYFLCSAKAGTVRREYVQVNAVPGAQGKRDPQP